jgi:RNA polymerase sigma factor (sigma-70 family)
MNDERLARRAAAGDAAAFEAIFRRYHQDLYRYCLATVGNPQDAQDALQNTMVKAMQALPGERREIKLKPWLYRVARNEAIETIRRRRDGVQLDPEREVSSLEIAESAADRERLRQLFADLKELPERQRSALVLRELAGLDFEEIGASFGTSRAVVRQTLYEARLSLRQMEEGREMTCETVTKALSDADGRVTRRRDLRAHLRRCASCRDFREEIAERRGEFAAIAPLPVALSAGLMQALAGSQAGTLTASAAPTAGAAAAAGAGSAATSGAGGAGGIVGALGAGVGKTVAGATIAKTAATVAVVAAVGVSAADRGGVVDLPLGGNEPTEARPALERRAPVADEASADPAAPGRQVSPGAGSQAGHPGPTPPPTGSGAAGQAKRAAAGKQGHPSHSAAGGSPQASGRGNAQGNAGGKHPVAGQGKPPHSPPPASSRGQENAGAHKPPPPEPPSAAATSPAPKPEQPPTSEGATFAPAPPTSEAPEGSGAEKGSSASRGSGGKAEPNP